MLSTFSSAISFNLHIFTDEETGVSEFLSNLRSFRYKRQKWDLNLVLDYQALALSTLKVDEPGLLQATSHQRDQMSCAAQSSVLKLEGAAEPPGGLFKTQIAGLHPQRF